MDSLKSSCGFIEILVWICRNPRVDLPNITRATESIKNFLFNYNHNWQNFI